MKSATLELTKALIEKPSVTPDDAGCLTLIQNELETIGFNCTPLPFENVSNLWATHGSKGPTLCFVGHTDVVPPGDLKAWDSPPFTPTVSDNYLFGRGACDMKGSLAAMLVAAKDFVKTYPNHPGRLAFLLTSDEEGEAKHGTRAVVEWLKTQNETIEFALVGEPSSEKTLGDTLKIGRRGSLTGKMTLEGIQGHVAYPNQANNPIHQAFPIFQGLIKKTFGPKHPDFPATSLQFSNIHAGTGATNVIPGNLEALFNFRFAPSVSAAQLIEQVEAYLQSFDIKYHIDWHHSGDPFITDPQSRFVQAVAQSIQNHTASSPCLSTEGGTSDGRFLAPLGTQIIELGPVNETIHQSNECVLISDLDLLYSSYYDILKEVLSGDFLSSASMSGSTRLTTSLLK